MQKNVDEIDLPGIAGQYVVNMRPDFQVTTLAFSKSDGVLDMEKWNS